MEMLFECSDNESETLEPPNLNELSLDSCCSGEDRNANDANPELKRIRESRSDHDSIIDVMKYKSESFKEMGREAVRLQNLLKSIDPDVRILTRHAAKLSRELERSNEKNDPRVRRFVCELELLENHVAKAKSDVIGMETSLSVLLQAMDEASRGSAHPEKHQEDTSKSINLDNDLQDNISDCDSETAKVETDDTSTAHPDNGGDGSMTHDEKSLAESKPRRQKSNNSESAFHQGGIPRLKKKSIGKSQCSAQCDICGKVFKSSQNMIRHRYIHSKFKPFQCNVCGKGFISKYYATFCKHKVLLPKESKSFVCAICGKISRNRELLRNHMKIVHETIRYQCLICNEAFTHHSDFYTHLATHALNDHEALKCNLCDEYFSDSASLISHLFEHHKKITCDICGKKFLTDTAFKVHKKFHLEQFPCQVCNRVLRTANRLKQHMNRHTGEKPYECEVCHMMLSSVSALRNHQRRVHRKAGVKCLICGQAFKTPFAKNSHYLEHSAEERNHHGIVVKMFTCEICGKTMRNEYRPKHLERHKDRSSFVCEICGKEFAYKSNLTAHKVVHSGTKPYTCGICGKGFARKPTLYTHKAAHKEDRPYACFCGKTYKLKTHLKKHETLHTRDAPYKCNVCDKRFNIRASYLGHMRTHSNEKPFACRVCGARFNQIANMLRHVASVHDKELRFKCDVCDKRFNIRASYLGHMRTHTDEKPFACRVCGARFNQMANMSRHVASVHDKKRRFKCDVCDKGFYLKTSLQIHYRIHTGEKPFTCHICGHAFSDPSTFHKHKAMHAKKSLTTEV